MFSSDSSDDENTVLNSQLCLKKRKLLAPTKPISIHSSLNYSPIKAPPIVEYKSVDSYCEKNLGKSLLPSHGSKVESTSDIKKVSSISSPVLLKVPKKPAANKALVSSCYEPPYTFFSLEELSLVHCLKNWANTKVCPIGQAKFDSISQKCELHSVMEKRSWKVSLDVSLLNEIPKLNTVIQIFGNLEIISEQPVVKIDFYRCLGSVDIDLFVTSYRMMQEHIPILFNPPESKNTNKQISPATLQTSVTGSELTSPAFARISATGFELNDTLDDYNLSAAINEVDSVENI